MNLDEVRKRLDRLNSGGRSTKGTSDYKTKFWKPKEGEKAIVRIVPYTHDKDFPFTELSFYFGIDKPRMISLVNFEESDPILEFATQLRKTGDEDNKLLAKKLYPKMRYFAPVLVRGEEDKGVRFWEFGKIVYSELLGVMADDDYGDITDIISGRDVAVEMTKESGKMYPTTTVRVKPKQTPLSEDEASLKTYLEGQMNITEFYTKHSYEDMKESLRKYIESNSDGDSVVESEPKTSYKGNKATTEKIDKLFD